MVLPKIHLDKNGEPECILEPRVDQPNNKQSIEARRHYNTINIFESKNCNNYSSFIKIYIPYSCKLLFQELLSMSMAPRFMIKN